ncbi:MAG: ATP-binding cassette domain-containing protein [Planctomycetota bacterium]
MTNGNGTAVKASGLGFRYGDREALRDVSFDVARGAVHGFLGPNGSGKSTLFKILATILPVRTGSLAALGLDLATDFAALRRRIGVVFQSPALDRKLTVRENLRYGGHLQSLRGTELEKRIDEMLEVGNLRAREKDKVGELSGGLRRRVEIAKGLLHKPELVLLDEPSTGLDPAARQDLWRFLRSQKGLTVMFTTHLMEEADEADALTILDAGQVVAAGTPDALRAELGGDVIEVTCADPDQLAHEIQERMKLPARKLGRTVRLEAWRAHTLVPQIVEAFGDRVTRLTLSQPSLEDVFIVKTGHRLTEEGS